MKRFVAALSLAVLVGAGSASFVSASQPISVAATEYANCTALNKVYKHGVGKPGAHDVVRGSSKPVTNFKVSKALYNANKKSDRDGDGVACEKL